MLPVTGVRYIEQRYLCLAGQYSACIVYYSFHALVWEEKAGTWSHLGLVSQPHAVPKGHCIFNEKEWLPDSLMSSYSDFPSE